MSKQTSSDSLAAMRDQDRHNAGDHSSHAKDTAANVRGHEHTKPAGDLRSVVDKEETTGAFRGERGSRGK